MVPPSEFDIEFYVNGKINENIDKVSTCVLEGISVDYAPNGFAAYETLDNDTGLGKTGMPVAIRMSLSFKETEYMTKDNYTGDQYRENAETRYISYREGMIKSADSNYQDIPQILNPETESMPEIYYGAEDIPQSTQE